MFGISESLFFCNLIFVGCFFFSNAQVGIEIVAYYAFVCVLCEMKVFVGGEDKGFVCQIVPRSVQSNERKPPNRIIYYAGG